jgi:ankyrin repeat protein
MLLAAGAEVDHASNDGETALILAAQGGHGHVEVIQALVTAGADPHRANNSGHTPLAAAEHEAAAQALVQAGATA